MTALPDSSFAILLMTLPDVSDSYYFFPIVIDFAVVCAREQ